MKERIENFRNEGGNLLRTTEEIIKNFAIRKPVLANLISMFLGGSIVYICLQYPNFSNLSVNIVIAIATCSATAIHYASTRNQRNDRIWDMNKAILLDLAYLLSEVIEEINGQIEYVYSNGESQHKPNKINVFSELNLKINNVLNVYKPLIGDDLAQKLSNYKSMNKQIEREVFVEGLDNMEAYEKSLPLAEELQKEVLKFIEDYSGVRKIV